MSYIYDDVGQMTSPVCGEEDFVSSLATVAMMAPVVHINNQHYACEVLVVAVVVMGMRHARSINQMNECSKTGQENVVI